MYICDGKGLKACGNALIVIAFQTIKIKFSISYEGAIPGN